MEIVIDIPDNMDLRNYEIPYDILNIITSGIPLPEHHGRLIDADSTLAKAWTNFYKHEDEWEKKDNNYLPIGRIYDQNGFECCQQTIVNAPTIIEAEGSEINVQ